MEASTVDRTFDTTVETRMARAGMQVYWLLRAGLIALPLLAGIDKFFNWTVNWPDYLAGWINDIVPGTAQDFMYFVGGSRSPRPWSSWLHPRSAGRSSPPGWQGSRSTC